MSDAAARPASVLPAIQQGRPAPAAFKALDDTCYRKQGFGPRPEEGPGLQYMGCR